MSSMTCIEEERADDRALIDAARRDPAAFEGLYRRWISPLYRYVYARLGNPADAEDVTAQVMLAAYQGLPRYQHQGNFAGWLFTIARNQTWRWITRSRREVSLDRAFLPGAQTDLLGDVAKTQAIQRLRDLVAASPEDQKELIYLRYVAGLTFADMAVVLKRSEAAVKKALYRLQSRLYSLLEDSHA